ncbi:hypothetical protein, partial [Acinetobacter baumannii]|uniref:hypothetical protein n=1 Tax=Acinetobacter baumannii TaxID=470 RepID=UPI001BB3DB43
MQASSFENYIAEKPFTDRFVQQSLYETKNTYSHAYQTVINYKNMAVNKVYRQLRTLNIDNSFPKIKLISLLKCINILNQTFNKRLFLSRFI